MESATISTGVVSSDPRIGPTLDLVVAGVRHEADDVVSLSLVRPDGAPLPSWRPGAHIDIVMPTGLERQYSLCGQPGCLEQWRVAVLREPEGRGGSRWVHEQALPGTRIQVRGPRNAFALDDHDEYVFIAGGIGITPILTMIAEVESRGQSWRAVYGGRSRASMAFLGELARYGEKVLVCPQDESGLIDVAALLSNPRPGVGVYCCGPEPLLRAVEARMVSWPPGSLHLERFVAAAPSADSATSFELELSASGITITVPADRTIVQAAEDAGIRIPTSCRAGTCGTCETPVLAGEPEHRDSFLTEEERAQNDIILVCCSRSRSPRLVLDL